MSRFLSAIRFVNGLRILGRDEERTGFGEVVRDLTGRGMVVAGILGLAAIAVYTLVYVVILRQVVCLPPAGCIGTPGPGGASFVMWDEILVAVGSGAVILLGRRDVGKHLGRLIVGCVAVAIGASLALEDALAGVSRLATAYAAVVLFITIGTMPFRPAQTLYLSVAMALGVFLAPAIVTGSPATTDADFVIFFVVTTAACTGISTLLYMNRYGQHRARRQVVQAEHMASLGRLAAGVAHEIENPLNFVVNFARISAELVDDIRSGMPEDGSSAIPAGRTIEDLNEGLGDLRENLRLIARHGERADRIVRLMLPPDPEVDSGVREPVDINRLVEASFNIAHRAFAARGEEIEVSVEKVLGKDVRVPRADHAVLHRALSYVINNALEALQERWARSEDAFQPSVSLRTYRQAGNVIVEVCDNGDGIAPDVGNRVFEPFYTSKPTGSHAGLGLYLAHQLIVEAHGGNISYDSARGRTCFRLSLPARPVAAPNHV